jgi:hypothetical protein
MAEARMLAGMVAATEDRLAVTFARLAECLPDGAEQLRRLSEAGGALMPGKAAGAGRLRTGTRWLWSRYDAMLGHGPVAEAQYGGNGPERPAEPSARLVRRVPVVDAGPAHLQVLGGQSRDRVGEFQG